MLHLTDKDLGIVQDLLRAHLPGREVWAFGSRVHGRNLKRFSDLDLAIVDSQGLDPSAITALQIAFADSDLPFRVDLVELENANSTFRKIIEAEHEVIQPTN